MEEDFLRKLAESDQTQAAVRELASVTGSFYHELRKRRVPRPVARQMTTALMLTIITGQTGPKT